MTGQTPAQVLAGLPGIIRAPTDRVELFALPEFLTPRACEAIVALIEAQRRPSTIADDMGLVNFRTSETCDLDGRGPVVAAVNRAICTYTGLDPAHGEAMQGQRYAVGQEFKLHTDYFEPGGADYQIHCAVAGQRTWTVMIYLNVPEAGGETWFKHLDIMFQPNLGALVA